MNSSGNQKREYPTVSRTPQNQPVRPDGAKPQSVRRSGSTSAQTQTGGTRRMTAVRVPSSRTAVGQAAVKKSVPPVPAKKTEDENIVRVRVSPDRMMILIVFVLLGLGSIMVFSASYPYALSETGDSMYYIKKQLFFIALGTAAMLITMRFPYKFYQKLTPTFFWIVIGLLVLVLFVGINEDEARRWIGIPGTTYSMQPSELMKPALAMMLAYYIEKHRDQVVDYTHRNTCIKYGVLYPGIYIALACGLVLLEKHLSGTIIIAFIGCSVLFIGGASLKWMAAIYATLGAAAAGLFVAVNPYALARITTFLNPNANAQNEDWQTTQGLNAIGSGGFFGVGLGNSRQKYSYVSQPQNDFIFTIWCEEMGFVGAVLVIALFMVFIWRGYVIAMKAPDIYSSLVAFGIVNKVAVQVLLNIAVVTDVIPNTGISLPFFSYGGSALIFQMAEMGILLTISRHSYQRK